MTTTKLTCRTGENNKRKQGKENVNKICHKKNRRGKRNMMQCQVMWYMTQMNCMQMCALSKWVSVPQRKLLSLLLADINRIYCTFLQKQQWTHHITISFSAKLNVRPQAFKRDFQGLLKMFFAGMYHNTQSNTLQIMLPTLNCVILFHAAQSLTNIG